MKKELSIEQNQNAPVLARKQAAPPELAPLQVNVLYTDARATALALETAAKLAADLGACIRLRAAIEVPFRLPLDQPQVSIPFTESVLSELASRLERTHLDVTAHLYVSRDRLKALSQAMGPNSLVVIAGRKRLWPTPESRIAKRLESQGHRILFIPYGRRD